MSVFTPGRRWQASFRPFHKERLGRRILARIEKWVKGPLFGCRMCGNCLLQETAFICPMECPKGMRNGPCGGSSPEKCYVDESRPCIWYRIYSRAFKMNREEMLLEVLPPIDWDKAGTETWGDVVSQIRKFGTYKFLSSLVSQDKVKKSFAWDSVFRPVRQPEWWAGDSLYHAPGYNEPVSDLEKELNEGNFVITAEVNPPLDSSVIKLKAKIGIVKDYVVAVNFTDSASSCPRMSSMTCSRIAAEMNVEPVFQIAARDKTRTGLQSEIIGANANGVRNILCISGDSPAIGPSPRGNMNILDIDAIQMLWILRRMRDEGVYLDGRKIANTPKLFLGAAASPFASDPKFQALREQKKVNAGAQFLQTNLIFDKERFDDWLEEIYKRDILGKVYILAGIAPLKSLKMAEYLHNRIPGVSIHEKILKRFRNANENSYEEMGLEIAMEIIESLRKKQGISGIHLMSVGWVSAIPQIVKDLEL